MSKEIDYISFTGQQYIFSGVTVNGNSTIEITCAYTGTGSDTGAIFGSRTTESGTDSTSFTMFVVNGAIRIDHFGTSKTLDKNKYNPNGKHTYKITPDTVYCDGTKIYTHTVSSNSAPNKLHIGAVCTNGTISKLSNVNIYSFKFYDGSNLILNLIPYKDNNKKYCFKDLVNNKLYYSGSPEELKGFDSNNIKTGDILNFNYTGAVQSITLPKGTYKLECWGAQGAQGGNGANGSSGLDSSSGAPGGKGGYSMGTLLLPAKTQIYVYVGGKGGCITSSTNDYNGGFNGGGSGGVSGSMSRSGGGGGATDIRFEQDSLYARVIVAGGGGATSWGPSNEYGDAGGGESSIAGSNSPGLSNQTSGNAFGIGANAKASSTSYNINGAGGGGWYGGISSTNSVGGGSKTHGGGGSGYVYTSSTAKNYPSGCLLNSSYYLSDAKTIAGNTSFTSPTGSSETGHSGNGYCRITVIECKNTALYTRINNSMKKATAFYFKLNNNKMYGVGSANSNPQNSTIMNFTYTGSVQTTTLVPGEYKFECWGASGGDAANATYNGGTGGKGGYSFGILKVSNTSKYYIIVGGQGQSYNTSLSKSYAGAGGFGGGGAGGAAWMSGNVSGGSGGGGLSGIFKSATYNGNEIIIAGGGGGGGGSASSSGSDHYHGSNGGAGGGLTGKDGVYNLCGTMSISHKNSSYVGRGGTQAAGGAATNQNSIAGGKLYGGGGGGYSAGASGNSTTLSGGTAQTSSNSSSSAGGSGGGGGGYYGGSGGGQYGQGAGGGSGYINPVLKNSNLIAGDQSFPSPTGGTETGHSDNGYCRITCYIKKKTLHCKMNNEIKKAAPVFMKMNNKIYDAGANAVMDFAYTGTAQAISLPRGQYIIECWGAQGGYRSSSDYGGKGGYSVGTLTLTQSTDLYIYVGGAGNSSTTRLSNNSSIYEGGFNGGGHRYDYKGGGGATDVRIGKDSLYARIIVAGGGGSDGATNKKGMYGGGLEGGSTTESCGSGGYGGTQTGNTWLTTTRSTNASYDTASCYAGFGFGGNGNYASSGYGGAGGGGWYGGSGSYPDGSGDDDRGGGGGSGYVYTAETAVNYPDGNYVNSSYYLTNAQTIAGNQSFKSPDGTNETGHTGNGFCRITRRSGKIFVKQNGSWIKV